MPRRHRTEASTPSALGQEIAAAIPGARWVKLEGAHIPHLEQPQAWAAAVSDFLLEARQPLA